MSKKSPARNLQSRLLGASQRLLPMKTLRRQAGKRVIAQFAESLGWVYFGHVDQHRDEHIFVRGFTASAKHFDTHYCVGSISGYDSILLQRTDAVSAPGKPAIEYRWLIFKIDLHTKHHPHFFVTSQQHPAIFYEYFFTKHYHFRQMNPSYWQGHSPHFIQSFTVFSPHDKAHDVSQLLSANITSALAEHFKGLEFELQGDALYIYASNQHVTTELLERMVKNGAWLAAQIDATSVD